MTEDPEAKCPCCKGKIEDFPDQDGSCHYQCMQCGWSEHVPGEDDIAAALTLRKEDSTPARPTVVVWVEGGLVQGVETDGAARVLVCDFDCEEEDASRIDGRACTVSDWNPPDEPGKEFEEALRAASPEGRKPEAQEQPHGKEANQT